MLVVNTGSIPAIVTAELEEGEAFSLLLNGRGGEEDGEEEKEEFKGRLDGRNSSLIVNLEVGEKREIPVSFLPPLVQQYKGSLLLRVQDNQFENTTVMMVGEGYEEEVVIENIHGLGRPLTLPPEPQIVEEMEGEEIEES